MSSTGLTGTRPGGEQLGSGGSSPSKQGVTNPLSPVGTTTGPGPTGGTTTGGADPGSVMPGPRQRPAGGSQQSQRAAYTQQRIAARAPAPTIGGGGGVFGNYVKSTTVRVRYSENKEGIMSNVDDVLLEIAEAAGVNVDDDATRSRFLDAMCVDVYVNSYSDKRTFEKDIVVGDFTMPAGIVKQVLERHVGTNYRRFARAMAPYVVDVLRGNMEMFGDILDKRMSEQNLGTRSDAAEAFDGADALINVDRSAATKNALAKNMKLAPRGSPIAYELGGSADAASSTYQ